jgi:general secretion pathway protein D
MAMAFCVRAQDVPQDRAELAAPLDEDSVIMRDGAPTTEETKVVQRQEAKIDTTDQSEGIQYAPVFTKEEKEKDGYAYLGEYLAPWKQEKSDELIEFLFDNAELATLIQYVEQKFNVTFITDDIIQPMTPGGKSILGTKISFRTHKPLNKKDAWNLFVAFLDMAGLAQVPGPNKNTYRLLPSQDPKSPQSVSRAPLPTFIGVDPSLVPNNDTRVRYVYFVENASIDTIRNVLDTMKSTSAPQLLLLPELNAIIITDKAANVRSMLNIVKELDQANMPESLAVVRLKRMDATKAAQLYDALTKKDTPSFAARVLGARKQATTEYFAEGARVIPEPRTNSLVILGSRDSIKKIVDFVTTIIDKKDQLPGVPLYIYPLKFLDADSVASILQQATQFQAGTDAAKAGGVRDGDKYLKPMTITAEKTTNSIVINADYDDYSKVYELLKKLDVEQPQVALKVFLLSVDLTDNMGFGTQIRDKKPGVNGLIGNNTNFQTSGLNGSSPGAVVENTTGPGATRLLGDLITLASGITSIGSTVVSLGSDAFGVWGMLNMLETHARTTLLANPFLVTTHKFPAQFSIGQKRYVVTSQVFSTTGPQNTFGYVDANLTIQITPQISKDGLVTLDTKVIVDQFLNANPNSQDGNRTSKRLETSVTVADNEVLALGGLIQETTTEAETRVPILGSIPLLGWFFKNKTKTLQKTSLLILIAPEIIKPVNIDVADRFTQSKVVDAKDLLGELRSATDMRDPVHRWLFHDADVPVEEAELSKFELTKERYTQAANLALTPQPIEALSNLLQEQQGQSAPQDKKPKKGPLKRSLMEAIPDQEGNIT